MIVLVAIGAGLGGLVTGFVLGVRSSLNVAGRLVSERVAEERARHRAEFEAQRRELSRLADQKRALVRRTAEAEARAAKRGAS